MKSKKTKLRFTGHIMRSDLNGRWLVVIGGENTTSDAVGFSKKEHALAFKRQLEEKR